MRRKREYTTVHAGAYVESVTIIETDDTDTYPSGWKFNLHYGTLDGETLLRYDNAHGTPERHTPDGTEEIDFPGMQALYQRFTDEIADLPPE
jgi:hypothetical protein